MNNTFPLTMNTSTKTSHPIVSLSLNPAIDLTYEITSLEHDKKSRATSTHYDPGGTGINVGRALEKLNTHSHTCCIIAGKMGNFLEGMLTQELKNATTLQVGGETRINTTIIQHSPHFQYEVNASGPTIPPIQLENFIEQFLLLCGKGIGILTGSLPPETPIDTYQKINIALQKQGGTAIIDAPVPVLKATITSQPFLIKPNHHELEILQNKTLSTIEEIASEARYLTQQGPKYVCVSLAEKGAILTGPENSYYCSSPKVKVNSTVGAGDSMVSGLAHAFSHNKPAEQALKLAVACGAATATQPGTKLFTIKDVERLADLITIQRLDI